MGRANSSNSSPNWKKTASRHPLNIYESREATLAPLFISKPFLLYLVSCTDPRSPIPAQNISSFTTSVLVLCSYFFFFFFVLPSSFFLFFLLFPPLSFSPRKKGPDEHLFLLFLLSLVALFLLLHVASISRPKPNFMGVYFSSFSINSHQLAGFDFSLFPFFFFVCLFEFLFLLYYRSIIFFFVPDALCSFFTSSGCSFLLH